MQRSSGWKAASASGRGSANSTPITRLRRYDFRHTACSDMLHDPRISFSTIEHMMGHRLGSRTKRKYDHIRNEALQSAAAVLDRGHTSGMSGASGGARISAEPERGNLVRFPGAGTSGAS